MKSIDIVYFEAASGHKTAADGLRRAISERHPDWDCRTVDLVDVLLYEPLQVGRLIRLLISLFNTCMRHERYVGLNSMVSLAIWFSRLTATWFSLARWGVSRFWRNRPPDMLISVTPIFNVWLYESARIANPNVICLTIPVDFEQMRSGYWFEAGIPQRYLLGCEQLRRQAHEAGVTDEEVLRIPGMIIDPRFYDSPQRQRQQLDAEFGLDPALPLGVISFGCQGTVNVLRVAEQVAAERLPVNLVCLCGHNEQLLADVRQLSTPFPCIGVGYRPEPPHDLLHAADFLIGKPGTMTLTEAIITQTPILAIESEGMKPIQRGNEEYIDVSGIGLIVPRAKHVVNAIRRVLEEVQFRVALQREYHRGVFEALDHIDELLDLQQSVSEIRRTAA